MVKNKSKQFMRFLSFKNIFLFLLGILILLVIGGFIFIKSQLRPVTEAPKTEMKRLPKDVARTFVPASTSASFRIPILLYHYVENIKDKKDTIRVSLNIPPVIFDQQIKTLSDAGYTFMTASEAAEVLDGKRALPPKPVLITIDDGHWDVDTDILPILEKYHAKATAYIITGFIGGSDFLTSTQLQDVIHSGLIEIGAHTVHHIALKGKILPLVEYEVAQSKQTLESVYHLHVVSFAYPDGSFDVQAANVVKNAGFATAVSTVPGISQSQNNRFFLYRIRPGTRIGQDLLNYLQLNNFKPW